MLSRELDAPVVSSGVKALHEEAMERAQGHTRRALFADPGGDQHLACLFGDASDAVPSSSLPPAQARRGHGHEPARLRVLLLVGTHPGLVMFFLCVLLRRPTLVQPPNCPPTGAGCSKRSTGLLAICERYLNSCRLIPLWLNSFCSSCFGSSTLESLGDATGLDLAEALMQRGS